MVNEDTRRGKRLLLRFPEKTDLYELLDGLSKKNGRSLTKEIIFRLEKSINEDVERSPIMKLQTSPLIELEMKVERNEEKFEDEIEEIKRRLAALESGK